MLVGRLLSPKSFTNGRVRLMEICFVWLKIFRVRLGRQTSSHSMGYLLFCCFLLMRISGVSLGQSKRSTNLWIATVFLFITDKRKSDQCSMCQNHEKMSPVTLMNAMVRYRNVCVPSSVTYRFVTDQSSNVLFTVSKFWFSELIGKQLDPEPGPKYCTVHALMSFPSQNYPF